MQDIDGPPALHSRASRTEHPDGMNGLSAAMGVLSPPGRRARLSILIFHRVLPAPDPLFPEEPDAARFGELLTWVRSWFNVLPLDRAVERLEQGTLPARAASITFDDGYADNASVASPILLRQGLTATFFIATGFLDGGCMWNDRIIAAVRQCRRATIDLEPLGLGRHPLSSAPKRRAAIDALIGHAKYLPISERDELVRQIARAAEADRPTKMMMSASQVRDLRASGMQIGAHTVSHPILTGLSLDQARREIGDSKSSVEQLLQEPVGLFAYPNGRPGVDYRPEHADLAREIGFKAAVTTGWGAADRTTDVMQLPRFTPWDRTRGRFGLRLLVNMARRPVTV